MVGPIPLGYKVKEENLNNYTKKELVIDPKKAEIVREAFKLRASNVKINSIIELFNKKGYKNAKGQEFTRNSLQRLFKNKRYIGTSIYGENEFPNTIPAIIDEDLFYKVQEVISANEKAPASAKSTDEYILTTKLYCDICNRPMKGTNGRSKSGNTYRYYTCKGHDNIKCSQKNYPKNYLEDMIISLCQELLNDDNINNLVEEIYKVNVLENNQNLLIKSYEDEISNLNKSINKLLDAIEKGENIDILNTRITQRKEELNNVERLLYNERKKLTIIDKKHIKFFLYQFKDSNINDPIYRKKLINTFVNQIHVQKNNNIIIIFNVAKTKITLSIPMIQEIKDNVKNYRVFGF